MPIRLLLLPFLLALLAGPIVAQSLETPFWKATVQRNGSVRLTGKSEPTTLTVQPSFQLIYRPDDPSLRLLRALHLASELPAWKRLNGRGHSFDLYQSVKPAAFRLRSTQVTDSTVNWTFTASPGGLLDASLRLTDRFPVVNWRFRPDRDGYSAVLFAPFAPVAVAQVASLWQPLIWTERRMPDSSYVSAEFMCTMPMTLVEQNGLSRGVSAHPSQIPYRMPNMSNSRFAVVLRNPAGQAQPTIMAPFFGRRGTFAKAGSELTFSASIITTAGRTDQANQTVARQLFNFADYRQNGTCSLNETIQNMTRFALDDHQSGWITSLRGSSYVTDVPGTVKNVSALHPLSVAVITDNEQLFRRRALPMTEYLLSREKYLFTLHDGEKNQNPSHFLRGPAAEVSELGALYSYSKGNSPVLRQYALDLSTKTRRLNLMQVSEGNSWVNQLALYRLTRDRTYLERAKAGALAYIDSRVNTLQTDFSDAHLSGVEGGQFWTDYTPKWMELLELYEETAKASDGKAADNVPGGEARLLEAARRGAMLYAMVTWLQPVVPPGPITVNAGDSIPMYYRNRNLSPKARPFPAREQQVPAWRVSNIGLTSESSYTFNQNPAIFLAHYAPYMLRIGHLTNDKFLTDIARSAVVGRYANFPGYDINYQFTTITQQADYPLHDVNEMTYNQLFYNHIWPHIALLYDYLITDVEVKSGGQIKFPSEYAQGYAYLQSKVYGTAPGTFFGDQNVSLWLPANLLTTDNIQINHLSGYGNGNTYLALTNQSADKQTVTVRLNPDVLRLNAGQSYAVRVVRTNQPADRLTMQNGTITVALDGHGVVGLVIEKLAVKPTFQHRLVAQPDLTGRSVLSEQTLPQGKATGMLLSWGRDLHNAYVYLSATEKDLKEARLHYSLDGKTWKTETDTSYPFEFSIPLTDAERRTGFAYRLTGITTTGEPIETASVTLN